MNPFWLLFGSNFGVFSQKIKKINQRGTTDAPKSQKPVVPHPFWEKKGSPGGPKRDRFGLFLLEKYNKSDVFVDVVFGITFGSFFIDFWLFFHPPEGQKSTITTSSKEFSIKVKNLRKPCKGHQISRFEGTDIQEKTTNSHLNHHRNHLQIAARFFGVFWSST